MMMVHGESIFNVQSLTVMVDLVERRIWEMEHAVPLDHSAVMEIVIKMKIVHVATAWRSVLVKILDYCLTALEMATVLILPG